MTRNNFEVEKLKPIKFYCMRCGKLTVPVHQVLSKYKSGLFRIDAECYLCKLPLKYLLGKSSK